jgi:hypothetical protein
MTPTSQENVMATRKSAQPAANLKKLPGKKKPPTLTLKRGKNMS